MIVLAHRGRHAGSFHRDNTLAAVEAAVRAGLDGVEVDVRASVDGQAVLYHDAALPDGTPVAQCSRKTMSRVLGFEVPTLDQLVERFPGTIVDVELKEPDAVFPALSAMRRMSPKSLLVTSFRPEALRVVSAQLDVQSGLILDSERPPGSAPWRDLLGLPGLRAVVAELAYVDPTLADWIRADGLALLVWGVKTPEHRARAEKLGADGVIVDA